MDVTSHSTHPFSHWVTDDAIPADTATAVAGEFPPLDDPRWYTFNGRHETGKQQGGPECWGPRTREVMGWLLSPQFCADLTTLTGIPDLVGDIHGGGMHQSGPGARLDIHVDFNRHPRTGHRRAVNLLLYLNPGWDPEWGGCLELHGDTDPVVIVPEQGRMVIFTCSDTSWHGHPVPVADGHIRRSLAAYYYAPEPVEGAHDTVWKR